MVVIWSQIKDLTSFWLLKDVAMATNFSDKMGKIDLFTFIRRPGIRKQIAISHFWFKMLICDDLASSCKHLANFCPVTPEFMTEKNAHTVVDQQTLRGSVLSLLGRSLLSFVSPVR